MLGSSVSLYKDAIVELARNAVMAARSLKIIQRFGNQVPAMASCSCCQYKFFTPSTLKRDPTAAEQYLREKFKLHECTDESPKHDATHMGWR